MTLPIGEQYEIVFLSQHPMGPQLGEKAVAKAVKCVKNTLQYWLNRWKESKDLSDVKRPGRPRVRTEKVHQRIYKLADSDHIATTGGIQSVLKRQHIVISQETIRQRLKEAEAKFSLPISKPLLIEHHRYDRLRWVQPTYDIDWNQIIFSDEATVRLNPLKRHVWYFLGEREVVRTVKNPIKVNVWDCFSGSGFGRTYCFRGNLNADLLCKIYKYCLLLTARNQLGRKSNEWTVQKRR